MRKCLLVAVLALASVGASANRASAWWYGWCDQAYYSSVSFPMQTPSGYFTNSYYFAWYYPWYANYNYSHGHYANWWQGGGYASYSGQQMRPMMPPGGQRMDIRITITEPGKGHVLPPPKKEMPQDPYAEPAAPKKQPGTGTGAPAAPAPQAPYGAAIPSRRNNSAKTSALSTTSVAGAAVPWPSQSSSS